MYLFSYSAFPMWVNGIMETIQLRFFHLANRVCTKEYTLHGYCRRFTPRQIQSLYSDVFHAACTHYGWSHLQDTVVGEILPSKRLIGFGQTISEAIIFRDTEDASHILLRHPEKPLIKCETLCYKLANENTKTKKYHCEQCHKQHDRCLEFCRNCDCANCWDCSISCVRCNDSFCFSENQVYACPDCQEVICISYHFTLPCKRNEQYFVPISIPDRQATTNTEKA